MTDETKERRREVRRWKRIVRRKHSEAVSAVTGSGFGVRFGCYWLSRDQPTALDAWRAAAERVGG